MRSGWDLEGPGGDLEGSGAIWRGSGEDPERIWRGFGEDLEKTRNEVDKSSLAGHWQGI